MEKKKVKPKFEKALSIAIAEHYGQKDYQGQPYILHILRVITNLSKMGYNEDDYLSAAALHDVVEDTECSLERLRKLGFNQSVIDAVDALTNRENEVYADYILRLSFNPIATAVKLADIQDHLGRDNALTFPKYHKYVNAFSTLQNIERSRKELTV